MNYLIFDINNLAWIAFHSCGGLSYRGMPTGVIFGVLGTVFRTQEQFGPATSIFCFDSSKSHRHDRVWADYKLSRKKRWSDPQRQQAVIEVRTQIAQLRKFYLRRIGFRNIFIQQGYEADDLIAAVCQQTDKETNVVIVSTDMDLLQLLSPTVRLLDLRKQMVWTVEKFSEVYGLSDPQDWAIVKSLAGCPTDGVKGIPGIGEKTAIKYLNGQLLEGTAKHRKLTCSAAKKIQQRNLRLVKLPYPGLPKLRIRPDKNLHWTETLSLLGIRSLKTDIPYRERPKHGKEAES